MEGNPPPSGGLPRGWLDAGGRYPAPPVQTGPQELPPEDAPTFSSVPQESKTVPDSIFGSELISEKSLDEVILSAAEKGVDRIITVGIDRASSEAAVAIAGKYPGILATVGVHPHNAAASASEDLDYLAQLAQDPANKVVGYGEIGLDYFVGDLDRSGHNK